MKVEITREKYERKYLMVLFAVMLGFFLMIVLAYAIITGEVWYAKIHLLFPGILGGAIGGMIGSRRLRMRLTDISNPMGFESMFMAYMNSNFKLVEGTASEEVQEYKPPRWDLRLFQDWMRQETIFVSEQESGYEIVAPKHSLDRIEAYVRFNKEIKKLH